MIKGLIEKYRDKDGSKGFCFYKMYSCSQAFHEAKRRGFDVFKT